MRLGTLHLGNHLVLAPMAGISDTPFRQIARERGCGLAFTGLMNAEGLLRKRGAYLRIERDDHPLSVQLFGSDPEVLAEAAQWAEEIEADAVDINMGCPASQVIGIGAGVDLMRSPEKVDRILMQVRKALKIPLSIKIRSGWDNQHINAVEISKIAEDCGVDGITIHPRTKIEGFRGRADWNLIGEVKRAVHIPVIGNGDVTAPFLAKGMLEETGCDGVMIGRGALGNPWIFSGRPSGSLEEKTSMIHHHFSLIQNYYGEKNSAHQIRKHLYWYTKGLPNCASFHSRLSHLKEKEALFEAIHSYFESIQMRELCQRSASEEDISVIG
jgi:tRNA-dihydrouridine synthase B